MGQIGQGSSSVDSDGSEDFGPGFADLVEREEPTGGNRQGRVGSDVSEEEEQGRSNGQKMRRTEDHGKVMQGESDGEDEDDLLGPMPTAPVNADAEGGRHEPEDQRKRELERLVNIPSTDFYECSFMHKKQVTHIVSSSRTGFAVTASQDGVVKFWRLRSEREIQRERDAQTKESASPVVTSLEFVKGYQAHVGEISDISISSCEGYMSSISEREKNIKLYSISDFDMISIIGIPINPSRCVLISSSYRGGAPGSSGLARSHGQVSTKHTGIPSGGLIYPQIAVSELGSGHIYVYSIRGDSLLRSDDLESDHEGFPRYSNHKAPITCMRFLPRLGVVVSGDISGGLEFWDPWTLALPKGGAQHGDGHRILFEYKIETDLFELQKSKCHAASMAVSPDERFLAIRSSDHKIRLFSVQTGRCIRTLNEDVSAYNGIQSDPDYVHLHIDRLDFGARSAVETEVQSLAECYSMQNLVFDETCQFLIYSSMIGICVLDVQSGRRILAIGKHETGKRFLSLALLQIHRGGASYSQGTNHVDSIIISSAFKSNRIYVFSKRLPLLDNGDVNLNRDIFNEMPSSEEVERQKQLEQLSKKGKEVGNSYIRIAKQVILHTTKGDITLELFPEIAPKACENFSVHCFNGYYNNCIFHRVIKGFMIQTGDPTGQGIGGVSIWGKEFEDEISPEIRHNEPFTLSMANAGPNTNGSQFFITTVPCPWLDGVHTIFGRAVQGKEIIKEIEHVSTNRNDRPIQDISIISTSTVFN
ncbi:cyclin [Cryptosporidium canis]|nr:cyclin [Cryptosporidium canis]